MSSRRRALHFVFKIANRKATIDFYRNVLGMKVLRHEEFEKGCEAACNGPYDSKWSKTMIGYGEEDNHFVVELTYNYGIKNYKLGNEFKSLTVSADSVLSNAETCLYPVTKLDCGNALISSPMGYNFEVQKESTRKDFTKATLSVSNLTQSVDYWHGLLGMNIYEHTETSVTLGYSKHQCAVQLSVITEAIDRAESYGRIAFSCASDELKGIEKKMVDNKQTILTPYITLDTPGKASVQVVILADPDGHEICFVGDEGFRELSQVVPGSDELLNKAMDEDKSDEYFEKKRQSQAAKSQAQNNTTS